MKKIFQGYSEDQMDNFLALHPKQYAVGRLKKIFSDPVDLNVVEKSRKALTRAFESMNNELKDQPWLAGDSYSLADIAAAPVIDRVEVLDLTDVWQGLDALLDWIDRLAKRAAYQRAKPKERMLDILN